MELHWYKKEDYFTGTGGTERVKIGPNVYESKRRYRGYSDLIAEQQGDDVRQYYTSLRVPAGRGFADMALIFTLEDLLQLVRATNECLENKIEELYEDPDI